MDRRDLSRRQYTLSLPGREALVLGERPLVMAILNVTPDSFAERVPLVDGDRVDVFRAVDLALAMEADGADIIDLGGESTRPGAAPVAVAEELARVVPVVAALAGRLRIPMSIDTYKADVARAALGAGAVMVNDVSGLQREPALARVVAEAGAPLVLMHSRGRSADMYAQATYRLLVDEVVDELRDSVATAVGAGVPAGQVIVDPGVGFAKRAAHSYGVLAHLPRIALALDRPILVGPSRKSFLCQTIGDRPAVERDWGTAAAVAAAVLAGAHILRVHAVAAMVQVVRVAEEIRARS